MTYCPSWERCWNSYLTTCTNLILCRAICLSARVAQSLRESDEFTRGVYVERACDVDRLPGLARNYHPPDVSSRCTGTYTAEGRAYTYAGLLTLRASEDNVGGWSTTELAALLFERLPIAGVEIYVLFTKVLCAGF